MPPKTPRQPLTHFLCLPLTTTSTRPTLEKSLRHIKSTVLSQSEQYQVPELTDAAFRPVGTLHLTLGVMSLQNKERVSAACKFLEELDLEKLVQEAGTATQEDGNGDKAETKLGVEPLKISLRGIQAMHAPTKTSTLYTPPLDQSNRLLPFANRLRETFTQADFVLSESRPLKLHATIVNTIYASPKGRSRGKHFRAAQQIDATRLIEGFKEFEFAADITLEKIAICRMGAVKTVDEDGVVVEEVYEEVAARELPR